MDFILHNLSNPPSCLIEPVEYLTGAMCVLPLPKKALAISRDTLVVTTGGRWCYCHLVGADQDSAKDHTPHRLVHHPKVVPSKVSNKWQARLVLDSASSLEAKHSCEQKQPPRSKPTLSSVMLRGARLLNDIIRHSWLAVASQQSAQARGQGCPTFATGKSPPLKRTLTWKSTCVSHSSYSQMHPGFLLCFYFVFSSSWHSPFVQMLCPPPVYPPPCLDPNLCLWNLSKATSPPSEQRPNSVVCSGTAGTSESNHTHTAQWVMLDFFSPMLRNCSLKWVA